MKRVRLNALLLLGTLPGAAGCGPSLVKLNSIAVSGKIDNEAGVKATASTVIHARPDRIWNLLIQADAWPHWQSQITRVEIDGPLVRGKRFTWMSKDTAIQSEVQLAESERLLSWTGTAMTAKAVHLWKLAPAQDSGIVVTVQESMDGPAMSFFYSAKELEQSERFWLQALKTAAEQEQ